MERFLARIEPYIVHGLHERCTKPLIDRAAGFALLVCAAPVMGAAALVLRRQIGPGGMLLRQQRIGRGGRPFELLKLRTMKPDRRQRNLPYQGPERRLRHKCTDDPRHTRWGRIVRKLSIDELPQLWNVVRGDMSLVGPRPELLELAHRNGLASHPRHRIKPGLTGPWQISADRDRALHECLERDLGYLIHITLWGDLVILGRTVGAVVQGRGS